MKHVRPRTVILLAGLAVPVVSATSAAATGNPDYTAPPPPTTAPPSNFKAAHAHHDPAPAPPATAVKRDSLPVTGGDIAELSLIGVGLVAAGGLVMRSRRLAVR